MRPKHVTARRACLTVAPCTRLERVFGVFLDDLRGRVHDIARARTIGPASWSEVVRRRLARCRPRRGRRFVPLGYSVDRGRGGGRVVGGEIWVNRSYKRPQNLPELR